MLIESLAGPADAACSRNPALLRLSGKSWRNGSCVCKRGRVELRRKGLHFRVNTLAYFSRGFPVHLTSVNIPCKIPAQWKSAACGSVPVSQGGFSVIVTALCLVTTSWEVSSQPKRPFFMFSFILAFIFQSRCLRNRRWVCWDGDDLGTVPIDLLLPFAHCGAPALTHFSAPSFPTNLLQSPASAAPKATTWASKGSVGAAGTGTPSVILSGCAQKRISVPGSVCEHHSVVQGLQVLMKQCTHTLPAALLL